MKYSKTRILSVALLFSCIIGRAQETPLVNNPPISLEPMVGNRGLAYQMVINKKLQSIPRLGFFGVTNFQAEWGKSKIDDYMLQGSMTYSLVKGVDLSSGFIWNPIDGIRPSAGVVSSYGNKDLLIVVNPRIDLYKNPNLDALALIEYKPGLNRTLGLYTRVQGMYSHNLGQDYHARSYTMLRAGVTYKDISLGLATNFDWYGPTKHYENNLGAFVLINLF